MLVLIHWLVRIKELARGESSMNCQMYGDPSKLRNLRLHSVHPSSWYIYSCSLPTGFVIFNLLTFFEKWDNYCHCFVKLNCLLIVVFRYAVAWYPIYRIAESDFRAAFLTYHSFGHFIHTAASSDTLYGDTCIACPVAGLQYYNTQVLA